MDLSSEMHGVKVQGAVGCRGCKTSVFPSLGRNLVCCHFLLSFCWGSLLAHAHRVSGGALGFPLPPLRTPWTCELSDEWEERIFHPIWRSFFYLFTRFFCAALTCFPHTLLFNTISCYNHPEPCGEESNVGSAESFLNSFLAGAAQRSFQCFPAHFIPLSAQPFSQGAVIHQSCVGSILFSMLSVHCWCFCLGGDHQGGTEGFWGDGRFGMAPKESDPNSKLHIKGRESTWLQARGGELQHSDSDKAGRF